LAAGLCPDPLGELKRSPRPPSRNNGGLLQRGGEGRRKGRGNLLQGVRGDRRPCVSVLTHRSMCWELLCPRSSELFALPSALLFCFQDSSTSDYVQCSDTVGGRPEGHPACKSIGCNNFVN